MVRFGLWHAYRLRWKRRRFLWRIWRKRKQIAVRIDRTHLIKGDSILCFACVRNEVVRLPYFLAHYRGLGVTHFLFVDNGSDDGTAELLSDQPDVSLWCTQHSYRLARFGMDWLGWLQWRYGSGRWCLTVDADELLIYAGWETRDLQALTAWLEQQQLASLGALMVDLYPKGPIDGQSYEPSQDPTKVLQWFDAGNLRHR
ncbi:MAG: glycosyltransferase family 2 protein, partial [Pseudomonadota bacterium]